MIITNKYKIIEINTLLQIKSLFKKTCFNMAYKI